MLPLILMTVGQMMCMLLRIDFPTLLCIFFNAVTFMTIMTQHS